MQGGLCGFFEGGELGVSRTQFVEKFVSGLLTLSALHGLAGYFLRDCRKVFTEVPRLQGISFCF